jgi:transcriptional regulator with GAF, ATPase, and Fis domain
LQEQEFERLGSGRTHKVDVRLVAATNRNLLEMVTRNEFRSDLYYRLNVFPIALPPLRARQEDIPELVTHFVEIFSQRMGKEVDYIQPQTMEAFTSYSWPGNIRELQNLIERAVILANDRVLPNPLPATEPTIAPCVVASVVKSSESTTPKKFRDCVRDLILQALDASGWVIGGSKGAATKLGLKRTSLMYKMKKLGIQRPAEPAGSPDANRISPGLASSATTATPQKPWAGRSTTSTFSVRSVANTLNFGTMDFRRSGK